MASRFALRLELAVARQRSHSRVLEIATRILLLHKPAWKVLYVDN
jgi:hypothetical protein